MKRSPEQVLLDAIDPRIYTGPLPLGLREAIYDVLRDISYRDRLSITDSFQLSEDLAELHKSYHAGSSQTCTLCAR